jgi:hypothetical protein
LFALRQEEFNRTTVQLNETTPGNMRLIIALIGTGCATSFTYNYGMVPINAFISAGMYTCHLNSSHKAW